MALGMEKGIAVGMEKGKLEERLEIAKKMLSESFFDINAIAKVTGLSVDELKNLVH